VAPFQARVALAEIGHLIADTGVIEIEKGESPRRCR
jgi:hypothetical protein